MKLRHMLLALGCIGLLALEIACGGKPATPTVRTNGLAVTGRFVLWRPAEIIAGFQATGLRAEVVGGESKDERDGLAMEMRVEAMRFRISEREDEKGMVLCFANAPDLRRMYNYYLALNQALPQFRSWIFVKDNVLLQINAQVPEAKAREYEAALNGLDKS